MKNINTPSGTATPPERNPNLWIAESFDLIALVVSLAFGLLMILIFRFFIPGFFTI